MVDIVELYKVKGNQIFDPPKVLNLNRLKLLVETA